MTEQHQWYRSNDLINVIASSALDGGCEPQSQGLLVRPEKNILYTFFLYNNYIEGWGLFCRGGGFQTPVYKMGTFSFLLLQLARIIKEKGHTGGSE